MGNPEAPDIKPESRIDDIRRLLSDAMRSLPEAQSFFDQHREDEELLNSLFGFALGDDSDSMRLQSCLCISRYPARLLDKHEDKLLKLQAEEWEDLSDAATTALAKIHSRKGLEYLISNRIAPKLSWEARILRRYLEDFLSH